MILFLFLIFCQEYNKKALVSKIAKEEGVPIKLLDAIISVESNGNPCAVYGAKRSHMCKTKKEAIHTVKRLHKAGYRNVNCGLIQINLACHKMSLKDIFDPETNLRYGARFLKSLHDRFGSWKAAVGYFHAGTKKKYYGRYFKKLNCDLITV